MANKINLQPEVLDLGLYAGDGVEIKLRCTDAAGAPIDITGTIKAQVRLQRLDADPALADFASNLVDAYLGLVVLSLTGDQTKALSADPSSKDGRFIGVWDVQWIASGKQPRTICQGSVECVADVTR
jgi:hypothetical protein